MGKNSNENKAKTLSMPYGTANNQLKKNILFQCLQALGKDFCFKCEEKIESSSSLSVEHIQPWEGREGGRELFFDLDNIAFSHLSCNRPHIHGATKLRDNTPEGMAYCRKCGLKPKEDFYKNTSHWNGVQSECKLCHSSWRNGSGV